MNRRAKAATEPSWSVLDLSEAIHVGHSLLTLERLGILESLKKPIALGKLATDHNVDAAVLEAALRMLENRTQLIQCRAGKYRVTKWFDGNARFVLLQYAGAYANNAVGLGRILRDPALAESFVDREQHARAFESVGVPNRDMLADLMLELGFGTQTLDIGSGTARMLLYLDARCPNFRGWGIDPNPWMCGVARKRISAAGASRRITIFEGDSRNLKKIIRAGVAKDVRALSATGVANEFFSSGIVSAVAWLSGIKSMFPGRTMFIFDYYSQDGARKGPSSRIVGLHDFIQVISGQGIPPASLAGWKSIYRRAGSKLLRVVEIPNSPSFIHVLKL